MIYLASHYEHEDTFVQETRHVAACKAATALLQAYDREHFAWKSVAHARLDRTSRVTLRVPRGVARARVVVVGTRGWADGVSQPVLLRRGGG